MTTPTPVRVPADYHVGRWVLTELIAAGSWGSVYAAQGPDGEPAAVKLLPAGLLTPRQHATLAEVTARELRFSRHAGHPRLVRTYETLVVHDPAAPDRHGAVAIVMERAASSLDQVLARARPGVPVPHAGRILREVCEGLAHMHAHGWIHVDLKPGNVLLMADGSVRLADFGLTAELDGTHGYAPRIGTPDCLPPEWWSEQVGAQGVALRLTGDIWAFGVLAHRLLTGGLYPFGGTTPRARTLAAQEYARGHAGLRLDGSLPPEWRQLVADCLAPSHAERQRHTADALLARVTRLTGPPKPGPTAPTATAEPVRRRSRTQVLASLAAVVSLLGLTASTPPLREVAAAARAPGELSPTAKIPAQYRPYVLQAKRGCGAREVSAGLVAAIIQAESGFDPKAQNPTTVEFGIAMWTPWIFDYYAVDADGDGRKSYLSPGDAIVAVGQYLCTLNEVFRQKKVPGDRTALLAAGYRVGSDKVISSRGVPPEQRPYVAEVRRHLEAFTTP